MPEKKLTLGSLAAPVTARNVESVVGCRQWLRFAQRLGFATERATKQTDDALFGTAVVV